MQRYIQGHDRTQASLLPAALEDYVDADNPARVIEAFVEALDLGGLGFAMVPALTGRSSYHEAVRPSQRVIPLSRQTTFSHGIASK